MNDTVYLIALLSVVAVIVVVELIKRAVRVITNNDSEQGFTLSWKQELLLIRVVTFGVALLFVEFGDAPTVEKLFSTDMAQWYNIILTVAGYTLSAHFGYDVLKRINPSTKSMLDQAVELLEQQRQ